MTGNLKAKKNHRICYQKQHFKKTLEGETNSTTCLGPFLTKSITQLNFLFHKLQVSVSILFCLFLPPFRSSHLWDKNHSLSLKKMQCHSSYLLLFKTHILLSLSNHELTSIPALWGLVNINTSNF